MQRSIEKNGTLICFDDKDREPTQVLAILRKEKTGTFARSLYKAAGLNRRKAMKNRLTPKQWAWAYYIVYELENKCEKSS